MAEERRSDERYFASLPDKELGPAVAARLKACRTYLESSGIAHRRLQSWRTYYGLDPAGGEGNTTEISRRGEQGELAHLKVNHYRSLGQSLLTLTTEEPPSLVAEAVNSDSESMSQALLMDGLLDAYEREQHISRFTKVSAESAIFMDEGYCQVGWDPTLGEPLPEDSEEAQARDAALVEEELRRQEAGEEEPEEQAPLPDLKTGDLFFRGLTAFDVINPPGYATGGQPPYRFVRTWHTRHDLVAQHPGLRDEILKAGADEHHGSDLRFAGSDEDFDQVVVWEFWHERTPACPQGKLVKFINEKCVLFSGPLPYAKSYIFRCAPSEMLGAGVGYTSLYDLLGLADAYNALTSIPLSNLESFGVGALWAPKGSDINYKQMGQGKAFIESTIKPEPIVYPPVPESTFVLRQQVREDMETLSGVNSTSRGNPGANLKSGAALVFMDSKTLQYSRGLQESYSQLLQDVGSAMVDLLKEFATSPRIAVLAGKAKSFTLKTFTKDDLSDVRRVVVKSGNPLQRSTSGKLELATMLLTTPAGKAMNPEQIIQLVTTGALEPLLEGPQAELLTIKSENERLSQGEEQISVLTDKHRMHILEHRAVLASPGARENPAVVKAVLAHIQGHIDILTSVDPAVQAVLAIVGEQSMAAPPALPPGSPEAVLPGAPDTEAHEMPGAPSMPINPGTGERAEAPPPVAV